MPLIRGQSWFSHGYVHLKTCVRANSTKSNIFSSTANKCFRAGTCNAIVHAKMLCFSESSIFKVQNINKIMQYMEHIKLYGSQLPSSVHNGFLLFIALTYLFRANTNKPRFHEFIRWGLAMKMVDKVSVVIRI
jgi:hypothetical protein